MIFGPCQETSYTAITLNPESNFTRRESIHFGATRETIETIFRIIVSANQLSLHGAVAEMCEEYESLHERTERPVVMGQSIVLNAIKTEVSLESDDPAYRNFLFQQYEERIEKLSQQDKLSKFCMEAGFMRVVEVGQYFMIKTLVILDNFVQWLVANTLCLEMIQLHKQKDGFKET